MNGNREFHVVYQLAMTRLDTGERTYNCHTGSVTLSPDEIFDAAMVKRVQEIFLQNVLREMPEAAAVNPTVRLLSWQQLESAEERQ